MLDCDIKTSEMLSFLKIIGLTLMNSNSSYLKAIIDK